MKMYENVICSSGQSTFWILHLQTPRSHTYIHHARESTGIMMNYVLGDLFQVCGVNFLG